MNKKSEGEEKKEQTIGVKLKQKKRGAMKSRGLGSSIQLTGRPQKRQKKRGVFFFF